MKKFVCSVFLSAAWVGILHVGIAPVSVMAQDGQQKNMSEQGMSAQKWVDLLPKMPANVFFGSDNLPLDFPDANNNSGDQTEGNFSENSSQLLTSEQALSATRALGAAFVQGEGDLTLAATKSFVAEVLAWAQDVTGKVIQVEEVFKGKTPKNSLFSEKQTSRKGLLETVFGESFKQKVQAKKIEGKLADAIFSSNGLKTMKLVGHSTAPKYVLSDSVKNADTGALKKDLAETAAGLQSGVITTAAEGDKPEKKTFFLNSIGEEVTAKQLTDLSTKFAGFAAQYLCQQSDLQKILSDKNSSDGDAVAIKITETQEKIQEADTSIQKTDEEITETQKKIRKTDEEIQTTDKGIVTAQEGLQEADTKIKTEKATFQTVADALTQVLANLADATKNPVSDALAEVAQNPSNCNVSALSSALNASMGGDATLLNSSLCGNIAQNALSAAQTFKDQKTQLEAEKTQLKTQKTQLEADKTQLETEKTQLEEEKDKLETEKTQLKTQKTQLEADKTQLEEEKDKLETEKTQLKTQKSTLEEEKDKLEQYQSNAQNAFDLLQGETFTAPKDLTGWAGLSSELTDENKKFFGRDFKESLNNLSKQAQQINAKLLADAAAVKQKDAEDANTSGAAPSGNADKGKKKKTGFLQNTFGKKAGKKAKNQLDQNDKNSKDSNSIEQLNRSRSNSQASDALSVASSPSSSSIKSEDINKHAQDGVPTENKTPPVPAPRPSLGQKAASGVNGQVNLPKPRRTNLNQGGNS